MKLKTLLLVTFLVTLPLGLQHVISPSHGTIASPYLQVSLYASDLAFLALFLAYFFTSNKIPKSALSYALFVIVLILGLCFTIFPRETYSYYWAIKFIEFFLLAIFVDYFDNFHVVAISLTFMGLIETLIAAAQFNMQHNLGLKWLGESVINPNTPGVAKIDYMGQKVVRAYGTFFHPNQLAAFLLVACATAIYLFLKSEKRAQQIIYAIIIYLLIIGEFLTFSRAGIAATLLMLAIVVVLHIKHKIPAKKLIIILLISVIVPIISFWPLLMARTAPESGSFTRNFYNSAGLKIFEQHWLLGTGVGNIIPAMAQKINFTDLWQVQPPHNYFILVACETGILGLAVIVWIFGSRLYGLIKNLADENREVTIFRISLLGSFIGILFLMFFDHYFYTLQQTQLLLWLMIGMITRQIKKT